MTFDDWWERLLKTNPVLLDLTVVKLSLSKPEFKRAMKLAFNDGVRSTSVIRQTKRIQRKRTKGWRKPDNCVCVTRPGTFGNPFRSAESFENWMLTGAVADDLLLGIDVQQLNYRRTEIRRRMHELVNKDLACYCAESADCHADVLLGLARELSHGGTSTSHPENC